MNEKFPQNIGDFEFGAEPESKREVELERVDPLPASSPDQTSPNTTTGEQAFILKTSLWQVDNLVTAGKLYEAHAQLLSLQSEFPASEDVQMKLSIVEPLARSSKLFAEGQSAYGRGEFGEAARTLTLAVELNPENKAAVELRTRAVEERDRLRQIRESLAAGQRAMREGDSNTAAIELQKVLQLDPHHAESANMLEQIQGAQASSQRQATFEAAMEHVDGLLADNKFEDAQYALQEMQHEFPDAPGIGEKLAAVARQTRLFQYVSEGEIALRQGEYGEAVRILTEAQDFAPDDPRIREMKARAVEERDRLRQVREAISVGQRAMRQGHSDIAEQQFERALQLDSTNTLAAGLLNQLQAARRERERAESLKSGLKYAENLIAWKKFGDAERHLSELQQKFPESESVQSLTDAFKQKRVEATLASSGTIAALPSLEKPVTPKPVPTADYAKSMALAEELRLGLEKARTGADPQVKPKVSSAPAPPITSEPACAPSSEHHQVTLVMGSGFRTGTTQAPPPLPATPPVKPVVSALKTSPAAVRKLDIDSVPIHVAEGDLAATQNRKKKSPVLLIVLGVVAVAVIVAFLLLHRR